MSTFTLSVESYAQDSVNIAVFVNPSLLVQPPHTIYNDMYPVAWRVFALPAIQSGSVPVPQTQQFSPGLRVFSGEIDTNNVVVGESIQTITNTRKTFQATDNHSSIQVSYLDYSSQDDGDIVNNSSRSLVLGFADSKSNPYFTAMTQIGDRVQFVSQFEFAICIVGNLVKGSVYEGDVVKPWVSFTADDVNSNVVRIVYKGNKLSCADLQLTDHPSTEKLFGGSLKQPEIDPITISIIFSIVVTTLSQATFLQAVRARITNANVQSATLNGTSASITFYPPNHDRKAKPEKDHYKELVDKALKSMGALLPAKEKWKLS